MVTAARFRPIHHNSYLPLYRAIEEHGRPLGFHTGYNWQGAAASTAQPVHLGPRARVLLPQPGQPDELQIELFELGIWQTWSGAEPAATRPPGPAPGGTP
jgi:hypothetical protein